MAKQKTEKRTKKGQWFFLIIFIPVVFALIIGVVLLSFLGVNVADMGRSMINEVPGISMEAEETETTAGESAPQADPEELAAKEEEIASLEQQLEAKNTEIQELEQEMEAMQVEQQTENSEQEQDNSGLQETAQVYESMGASAAASILAEMSDQEVVRHLSETGTEMRADILAEMEPQRASVIINSLSE
ncbi:MotE family protein [Salibacterium lacus]|uniref:MotE family protein n=1 Tax=Salibacterium lacus TaxID=1898109 RepID=A0ABW5SZA6_9BACI